MSYKIALVVVAACLALFRPFSCANAQDGGREQVLEKTFKVKPGALLRVKTDIGAVSVKGVAGLDAIQVRVRRSGSREAMERFDVRFSQTAEGLEIVGELPHNGGWFRTNRLRVEYEIRAPKSVTIDLNTAGGPVTAEEIHGDAHLRTSGGPIEVASIDGRVDANTSGGPINAQKLGKDARLHTSGGPISVDGVRGDADLNTSGGGIDARNIGGNLMAHTSGGHLSLTGLHGSVDATTSGGPIDAELLEQPQSEIRLETSGGPVRLRLPSSIRASLEARSSGSRINCDLPVQGTVKKEYVKGDINGGGPAIYLKSSGGGVSIEAI